MNNYFLYQELDILRKLNHVSPIPDIIENGLNDKIKLRTYQKEALQNFITYFENDQLKKNKQVHSLFHMATGSGKTVIMASLILYLYTKGYNNFLFFVNQTNILEKTKENFLNNLSSKYLFDEKLQYLSENIKVNSVDNFSGNTNNREINICFTTTQKLHLDLTFHKENSLTYDDFENNKVVFISDESHHVNTLTKKLNKTQEEEVNSWEYSVMNSFNRNKDNILLEFTATADLKDKNVKNKYLDKIIYNYPLFEFRQSGYTKDFQNFATNSSFWDRTLIALIMSEYRKQIFFDNNINIKPVVLLKSRIIKDSESFYDEFHKKLSALSIEDITKLYNTNIAILIEALNYFKFKDSSFLSLVTLLKLGFSVDNSLILNGASDNNEHKQILVNSLEDDDNKIRLIFTVDMLNEGWDVLNLFDIVRLYDTRQGSGKPGKVGEYTIKEAQLIGRGARYCPFVIGTESEKYKRKYDYDLTNKNRILETMFYHSKDDSKYIAELKQALIQTGMQDDKSIKQTYTVKESFKETDIYKKGYIFSNKRMSKGRTEITSIEGSLKHKTHYYSETGTFGNITNLFEKNSTGKMEPPYNVSRIKFNEIPENIMSGASTYYKEFNFNILQKKYPNLKSKKDFFTSNDYLGNNILEIKHYNSSLSGKVLFKALINSFESISLYIINLKDEYVGSTKFTPYKLSEIIKDKTINLSKIDLNGGKGESQNLNPYDHYQLDLQNQQWYVYNDNYGTNEEKLAIKYFYNEIKPKLDAENLIYYVIRNERIPELAIYSFEHGERFEPDFLILIQKENKTKNKNYQIYFEPKGAHLIEGEIWKEEFLLDIEHKFNTEGNIISDIDDYYIIGLPFFNSDERMEKFSTSIDEVLNNI